MRTGVTLKSIELAGFKSFAKRTRIDFEEGLCAVVGPNGSGKSNIADAIRWVFGEQRSKLLRFENSQDVIFHGTDKKPRASMTEVIVTLDNSNGDIGLDFNQIEIARQLYRSGESNYIVNNKKVTMNYVAELLAKSGLGIGSYTVIGQGMIDKLILSSGQERKLLFDEASGIKQYEIKLAQTRKKITESQKNLEKLKTEIDQIVPEYNRLAGQAKILEKSNKLKKQLSNLKQQYYSYQYQECIKKADKYRENLKNIKDKLDNINRRLLNIKKDREKLKRNTQHSVSRALKMAEELEKIEKERETILQKINEQNTEYVKLKDEITNDNSKTVTQIKNSITEQNSQIEQNNKKLTRLNQEILSFESKISEIDKKINQQTKILNEAQKKLSKSQKKDFLVHALGLIDLAQKRIQAGKYDDELNVIFFKIRRMIKHSLNSEVADLALQIGRLQNVISRLLAEREELTDNQTAIIIRVRALEMDITSLNQTIDNLKRQLKLNQQNRDFRNRKITYENLKKEIANLRKTKSKLDKRIKNIRNQLLTQAQSPQQSQQDIYYKNHEHLTSEKIRLTQELAFVKQSIRDLENQQTDLEKLAQKWFDGEIPKIKKPIPINLEKINLLEAEIRVLGQVDFSVIKDSRYLAEKIQFYNREKQDLEQAIENLGQVVLETEAKMKQIFTENFAKINQQFDRFLNKLFEGGSAELKLIREEDDDYGIEILINLPNKKIQNLHSLSGGERSLASVALLAAILSTNPSPFVILDEVDAALDETNTAKFAEILSELSKKSQIIVISHNHATMSLADNLIGVTLTPKKVSQILKATLTGYR